MLPFTVNSGNDIFSFVVDSVRVSKSESGICKNIFCPSADGVPPILPLTLVIVSTFSSETKIS